MTKGFNENQTKEHFGSGRQSKGEAVVADLMEFCLAVIGSRDGLGHCVIVTESELVERWGWREGRRGCRERGWRGFLDHKFSIFHLDTDRQPFASAVREREKVKEVGREGKRVGVSTMSH